MYNKLDEDVENLKDILHKYGSDPTSALPIEVEIQQKEDLKNELKTRIETLSERSELTTEDVVDNKTAPKMPEWVKANISKATSEREKTKTDEIKESLEDEGKLDLQ